MASQRTFLVVKGIVYFVVIFIQLIKSCCQHLGRVGRWTWIRDKDKMGSEKNQPSHDLQHITKQPLIDNQKERSLTVTFTSSIRNMPQNIKEPQASTLMEIPEGFTVRVGPRDKEYLVPQYMIPALDQAFVAYHHKADLNVLHAELEVCHIPYSISAPPFLSASWDHIFRHCDTIASTYYIHIVCPNYW